MSSGAAVDWDWIYSHLLTCFPGWTWEYIDDYMTIPRYLAISNYQHNNPPLHLMVAAYLGAGKDKGSTCNSGTDENGQSLFDLFPMTSGET